MKKLMWIPLLSLISCASATDYRSMTVPKVDLDQFFDRWYVWSNIPNFIEKGCTNSVEAYTWNKKEKRIDIDFTCMKDGEKKSYPQKGWVFDKERNSHWKVQLFWPLKFNYLIVYIAPDYSATVVTVPDGSLIWIMGKNAAVDEKQYAEIIDLLKSKGYDLKELERVPQKWDL